MSTVTSQDQAPVDYRVASERPGIAGGGLSPLWFGIIGPLVFVLLNLEVRYALTAWMCRTGDHFLLQAATGILLLGTLLAGVGPARQLHRDWLEDTVLSRPGFMAMLGILLSALGAVVILAQWLPTLYLSTCQ
jgi:hypothetical protein